MKTQYYDLIGDIHGQHEKLMRLLQALGYQAHGLAQTHRHADGRKVIFLGDYIDRGPAIRETLQTVRGMCDAGDALAIMGNHEFNAICYNTPDGQGGHLRQHSDRNQHQHQATIDQFADYPDEWAKWLDWFKDLPLALDLGDLRAVHACWDGERLPLLLSGTLRDEAFLAACANRNTPQYQAIENVLKGPEMHLPKEHFFVDKEGVSRRSVRARWWDLREDLTLGDLTMPPGALVLPVKPEMELLRGVPSYAPEEPPVFVGHYWLPEDRPYGPLAPNIACLDYSAGLTGPLVAYSWDGEAILIPDKFMTALPR